MNNIIKKDDNDNIYFNARLSFGKDSRVLETDATYAKYEVTQNKPLLNNPTDYYVAVTDYIIPLQSLPLGIARVFPNQPNPNLMTAEFTIRYLGVDHSQFVIFVPSVDTTLIPPPIQNQPYQVVTTYYYIYSYTMLLECFNTTLASIYNNIGFLGTPPRFILLQGDFPKIQLIVDDAFITAGATIQINNAAINYLDGFQYKYYRYPLPIGDRYEITMYKLGNVCDINGVYDSAGSYWQYTQQYYCLPAWNPISKIIIYSSTLPIKNQTTSSKTVGNPDLVNDTPILFSFSPNIETTSQGKGYVRYNIGDQYRLTDLISSIPLKKIGLQIAWLSHEGEVLPFFLRPYETCEIQLGFFKKSIYNNNIKNS